MRKPIQNARPGFSARWTVFAGIALIGLLALQSPVVASGEQTFASSDQAVSALVAAAKSRDTNTFFAIFGTESQDLLSHDVVQATNEFEMFVGRAAEKADLEQVSDSKAILKLGKDGWPFPVPLVKRDGKWYYDTAGGKEEILNRRIGRNELSAIQVCREFVSAQREYAGVDRNGDDVIEYAQRLRSTPGARDGLYWPARGDEDPSPFGPLIAEARSEGYRRENKIMGDRLAPFRGYYFKILTEQGRHAPGGKYNYIINGRMIAGFALAAWPAEWGDTGIMTCIVNQQGKVYQKNLGAKTGAIAMKMKSFDPDPTWSVVPED